MGAQNLVSNTARRLAALGTEGSAKRKDVRPPRNPKRPPRKRPPRNPKRPPRKKANAQNLVSNTARRLAALGTEGSAKRKEVRPPRNRKRPPRKRPPPRNPKRPPPRKRPPRNP